MLVFEDFTPGDVYELGSYTVTKEEILKFAQQYDPQPFHIDERAAEESIFGELVASGWHTAGILCRLAVRGLFTDVASAGGIGVDDLRWPVPVKPGDTLSGELSVVDTRPSDSHPERGYADFEMTLENQRGETVLSLISYQIILRDADTE